MKHGYIKAAVAALGLLGATAASANLVSNGGFETLIGSPTLLDGSWEAVANGGTRISGWSVGDTSVDVVTAPYAVQEGQFAIDLAGTPGPGSIFQSLSTVAAQPYTLSFHASSNGPASTLEVWWGGSLIDTVNTPAGTTFQFFSYLVAGVAGPSTVLSFRSTQTDNDGAIIDNVSVNAVPVPAAVWLLGSALLGVGVIARRRTRNG
jgi:hypothetical protein